MITERLIQTKVGAACARLGYPIPNAYDWQDTGLTEQQILDEIAIMDSESPISNYYYQLENFYLNNGWSAAALSQASLNIINYTLINNTGAIPLHIQNYGVHQYNLNLAKNNSGQFIALPNNINTVFSEI
jgi:hypothetical protein